MGGVSVSEELFVYFTIMETSNIINRVITFTAVKSKATVLCDRDG